MTPPAPKRPAGSFRELWQVALPLVLSSGSLSLTHVVDRVLLTWYSTEALAAATPAAIMHWTLISVLFGTGTYVNTFVAQYEGANRQDRVAAAVWQGVYLSLIGGVGILLFVPLAGPLFALIGHQPTVQTLEADYFQILCAGTLPIVLTTVLSCFYSGRGRTVVVLWVNLVVAAVNIGLDYCLIFGHGPFPQWGIRGAGVATVSAYCVGVLCFAVSISSLPESRRYSLWRHRRFNRELFGRLLRYGLPNGMQVFGELSAFALFIAFVGKLGPTELAATNVAFNLNSLAFIPMIGIGIAVMTLVGKRIGEGRPELAVRTAWLGFALTGTYMLLFAVLYLGLPDLMLYPYAVNTPEAEFGPIRAHVIRLLRFVAVYSFFDGMAIVFGSAVRGAGDTRFSMWITILCVWLVMVVPTVILWSSTGGNLILSWWACTLAIIVQGVAFLIRFQGGRWKSMRVIEPHDVPIFIDPQFDHVA